MINTNKNESKTATQNQGASRINNQIQCPLHITLHDLLDKRSLFCCRVFEHQKDKLKLIKNSKHRGNKFHNIRNTVMSTPKTSKIPNKGNILTNDVRISKIKLNFDEPVKNVDVKHPMKVEPDIIFPILIKNAASTTNPQTKSGVNSVKSLKFSKVVTQKPSPTLLDSANIGNNWNCSVQTQIQQVKNCKSKSALLSNSTFSGDILNWPIRSSLFPNIPPYIQFNSYESNIEIKLPNFGGRRFFKWKLSTITPDIIKGIVVNTGFALIRSDYAIGSSEWLGTWGKHMKSRQFILLKDSQKINHFPGSHHLGRKDRLWKNFQRMINRYGFKEFGFLPLSYILPQELNILERNWIFKDGSADEMWILKPPDSARGMGIKIINRWMYLPQKSWLLVQKYISNPYLINARKFDLRMYVLVTSFNPLRIYLYPEGLARFASAKYSKDTIDLENRFVHLTNYSINKMSSKYAANDDASSCQGHKWTISKLLEYLENTGVNIRSLWNNFQELVIKTMIACEPPIVELCKQNLTNTYNCYELFGVDILLDDRLNPWLLEVNISPSLHSESPLDAQVKGPIAQTLLNMAQFHLPPKLCHTVRHCPPCFDPRLYTTTLTEKEKEKQKRFLDYETREIYLQEILKNLTEDDVRYLTRAEDELVVKGRFERIFPTPHSFKYLNFMERRYYNRLFDAWEAKYANRREDGISLLQVFCNQQGMYPIQDQFAFGNCWIVDQSRTQNDIKKKSLTSNS